MMLSKKRPAAQPMPTDSHAPFPAFTASTTIDDSLPLHVDYNFQPLLVRSLDHYVEHDDNERFHVR
jgi:hypothetical protein